MPARDSRIPAAPSMQSWKTGSDFFVLSFGLEILGKERIVSSAQMLASRRLNRYLHFVPCG